MDKDREDRQDIQPDLADPENLQDLQVEQKKEAAEAQPLGEEKAPKAQPEEEDLKEKDDVLSIQYDEDNDEKGTKKEKALRRRPFLIGLCAVVAICIGVCVYLLRARGLQNPISCWWITERSIPASAWRGFNWETSARRKHKQAWNRQWLPGTRS